MLDTLRDLRFGLGPVFACEWAVRSRRWQTYAVRSLFAGMLLTALSVAYLEEGWSSGPMSHASLAETGLGFFVAGIGTQLALVLLAAPAATAGAICADRASGALTLMLVTDLSSAEVVLGKLAARLVPVLGLVACGLPMMTILTFLGGVDPTAVLGAFLVTAGVAVLGCSLALFFSLRARKAHEALLATYLVWGIWLLERPFIALANSAFGWSLASPPQVADPYFLALRPYWASGTVSFGDYAWFLAITVGISAIIIAASIFRLRAACTRVDVPKKRSLRARLGRLRLPRFLPGPALDFNPVLWREWHRNRPSPLARIAGGVFVVGAAAGSLAAILLPRMTFAMAWANALQVSIGLLLLAAVSATSLSEERARGSLDVLMTTALSTREIVMGKWLGAFRFVPWMAILPTIVILFTNPAKHFYLPSVFLIFASVCACGAAVAGLGLAMATWCSRPGRAVAVTVSAYIFVAVGWLFVGLWVLNGTSDEGMIMVSPFMLTGVMTADLCDPGNRHHLGWVACWTAIYATVAAALFFATLATFNRCFGRVEAGPFSGHRNARMIAGPPLPIDPAPVPVE